VRKFAKGWLVRLLHLTCLVICPVSHLGIKQVARKVSHLNIPDLHIPESACSHVDEQMDLWVASNHDGTGVLYKQRAHSALKGRQFQKLVN
jgi:hypothetical protein